MPDVQEQKTVEEKQPESMLNSNETHVDQKDEIGDLPEDASERTKEQFEKLKARNKELSEQLRQKEVANQTPTETSVFDSLRPPVNPPVQTKHLSQTQVTDIYAKLTDENGYIDTELLKQALLQAEERASRAEMEAKRTRDEFHKIQEDTQVRTAHKAFPQLDPKSSTFNQGFYNAVKNEMVSQMLRGEKDLVLAAQKVAEWFPLPKEESKQETVEKKETQVKQIQAAGSPSGSPKANASQDDLVKRTLAGDDNALAERLRRAGY